MGTYGGEHAWVGTLVRASRILVFVGAAAILALSLLPHVPQPLVGVRYADKIEHFLAYFLLGALVFLALGGAPGGKRVLLTLLICVLFGGIIEYLQRFTGRTTELADLAVDGAGAGVGAAAALSLLHRALPRRSP